MPEAPATTPAPAPAKSAQPPASGLPPVPKTAVAPTPTQEYKISDHTPPGMQPPDPRLRAALEKYADKAPAAPEAKPAAPAADDDKPAAHVKFIVPDEQPAEPAPEPAAKSASDEPPPEVLKSASAQLKEVYEKVKAQRDEILKERDLSKKEASEFRNKLKALEDRSKALEGADARAKELEQRVLAQEEKLRISAYTQTDEFHNQFVKPVADATENAVALVKELMVNGEDGTQRYGTKEDFFKVLGQPNYSLAKAKARELFGEDFATEVFESARRVGDLQRAQGKALEQASIKSQEWAKQQAEAQAAARTQARSTFEAHAKELVDAHPNLYTPAETDQEGLSARQQGERLASLVLGKPEEMTMDQYVSSMAKVYQRAASWPMKELAIHRLTQELEATKAKLAAYEKSSPDTSSAQRPGGITEIGNTPVTNDRDALLARMRESLTRRATANR